MSTSPLASGKPVLWFDQLPVYRVVGTAVALVMVVFLLIPQDQLGLTATQELSEENRVSPVVEEFIREIQAARALVRGEGGQYQREEWSTANRCVSRVELAKRYEARRSTDFTVNPQWRGVLREYSTLHRTCMQSVGNVTAYFMNRNMSSGCKFTVVDTDQIGIGNRFLVIASAVMYSILTNRVVLLAGDEDFMPADLVCEPFEGSSWRGFDVNRVATPYRGAENRFWNHSGAFHGRIDEAVRNGTGPVQDYAVANMDIMSWVGQPQSRFYCDVEQESYKNVTFMYLTGMLYFLPKLFTVPSFRPVLEALFPGRMVLTSVLREVMLPSDQVWARVQRMEDAYLADRSDRRLGVQLRYFGGRKTYELTSPRTAARVLQCALDNAILPPYTNHTSPGPAAKRRTTVFVASLYEGVKNNLTETFLRHPTQTGESVKVVQLSSEGDQRFGTVVYQGALAEALVLSFSDHLFVTPKSTFSGLAQAYGGVVPWFIDWRDNITQSGPCTRAQTVDVCFQAPFDFSIQCPYDHERHEKKISEVYPDIQSCLDVDTWGLQLITKNDLQG